MQLVTGVTEALQLAPQVTDVHVQAAIMLGMTAVQDMLVKEGLGQGLAFRGEEGFQQAVFGRRQAGEPLAKADIADIGRELQRGPRQRFGSAARRAPPLQGDPTQDGIDAYPQLGQAERLRQIIVGALAEPGDAVLLGAQG